MLANKLKQMFADEGAVSPVIGVILMVAVTVVLAAVIGAFVFGIGDSLGENAPNAQIDFDYDADESEVQVAHDGGTALTGSNTGALEIAGDEISLSADAWEIGDAGTEQDDERSVLGEDDSASAGDNIVFVESVDSNDDVTLYWEGTGGDTTSALGEYTAP